MKLKLIFAIILAIPTLTTCQKAREKRWCKNPIKIPQRVVDYFYFKEGTYWVYENETTHEVDSQWVYKSHFNNISPDDLQQEQCNCTGKLCYESIGVKIGSTIQKAASGNGYYLEYLINFDANQVSKFTKDFYVYKMKFTGVNRTTGFSYKFDNNDKWEALMSVMKDTSINIFGISYKESIYFKDSYGSKSLDVFQECYLARNIGYIRFKDVNNNYWSLIRKNIVK
jgi:hypothetical protein